MSDVNSNDPMVDEIREIRRRIAADLGNDFEKLAEHLRQVDRDYAERRGIFAAVTREAATRVEESWGDMTAFPSDTLVDEVRAIRNGKRKG
jgi:hypothetical protein